MIARPIKRMLGRHGASLEVRFVLATVAGEMLFALALGLVVGMFTVRQEAALRSEQLRQTTAAIAASVMPMIADQEAARLQAQLDSVLERIGHERLDCLVVEDSSGAVIARSRCTEEQCDSNGAAGSATIESLFGEPQTLSQPIIVDGLTLATVHARFKPLGVARAMREPLLLALVVVASVSLVSLPWTAWLFVSSVGEPLQRLREGAGRLASGELGFVLHDGRMDEIGHVQMALDEMSAKLADRQAKLEEAYSQMQRALSIETKAKQELENLVRMKSDFVAVASHELRGPLAVIRLYSELLSNDVDSMSPSDVTRAMAAIGSASARLSSIVADLMDAALLERGMISLNPAPVPLEGIVLRAVEDAQVLCVGGTTTVRIDGELPSVLANVDALRVRQVLDNLISNAVKYSEGAPEVLVRMSVTQDEAVVSVVDFGKGIPEDKAGRLFQMFGRLEPVDSGSAGGLGLGLAISERIVQAHGGSLTYQANPAGKGSIFTMRIPQSRARGARRAQREVSMKVVDR